MITHTPEVLARLAQITAERDLALLEGHLLSVFRELVGRSSVSWLRIDPANDHYTLCRPHLGCSTQQCRAGCAPPQRHGGSISGAPPGGLDPEQWAALVAAIHIEHPLCLPGESGEVTVYPLRGADHAIGFLLAHERGDAAAPIAAGFDHILAIFRNYYALLEENQRDKLTGLLNRKTFDERIGKLLNIAADAGRLMPGDERRRVAPAGAERFWLAVADIDHFKRINDGFGHLYGDEVLLLLARIMKRTFRHNDLLFRFGGEEFVIVVGAPDCDSAYVAFEKFRRAVASYPFPQIGTVTISLGATEMEQRFIPSALVGRADEALYHAKNNGRDQLCFYEHLVARGKVAATPQQGSIELF